MTCSTRQTPNLLLSVHGLVERALFRSRSLVFFPIAFVATVLLNGVWIAPAATRLWWLARDPYCNPFAGHRHDWLLDNYLLPWLAHHVGAGSSLQAYVVFCFAFLLLGLAALVLLVRRRSGDRMARSALILFAISPVSLVSLEWLGYVDFLTVLFGFVLAFYWDRLWLISLAGFLMGLNHWTQGLAIAVVTFVCHLGYTDDDSRLRSHAVRLVSVAAAVIGAYLLLKMHFAHCGMEQQYTRLTYVVGRGLGVYWWSLCRSWGLLLYSLFGGLWVFAILWAWQASARARLCVGAAFALAFSATCLNLDQTRVFSLLTWPILLVMLRNWSVTGPVANWLTPTSAIAWVVVGSLLLPKLIVWDGKPHGALIYHDIRVGVTVLSGGERPPFSDRSWLKEAFMR